jgi:hypothetical protein
MIAAHAACTPGSFYARLAGPYRGDVSREAGSRAMSIGMEMRAALRAIARVAADIDRPARR